MSMSQSTHGRLKMAYVGNIKEVVSVINDANFGDWITEGKLKDALSFLHTATRIKSQWP